MFHLNVAICATLLYAQTAIIKTIVAGRTIMSIVKGMQKKIYVRSKVKFGLMIN